MSIYLHSSTRKTTQATPPQEAPQEPIAEPAIQSPTIKVNVFKKLLRSIRAFFTTIWCVGGVL